MKSTCNPINIKTIKVFKEQINENWFNKITFSSECFQIGLRLSYFVFYFTLLLLFKTSDLALV